MATNDVAGGHPVFDWEQVRKHKTANDLWIVLNGKVYDVSNYLGDHPGGADILLEVAGEDATESFDYVGHSASARRALDKLEIGSLAGWIPKLANVSAHVRLSSASKEKRTNLWFSQGRTARIVTAVAATSMMCGFGLYFAFRLQTFQRYLSPAGWNNGDATGFWGIVLAVLLAALVGVGVSIQSLKHVFFPRHKSVFEYAPYYHYPIPARPV